MNPKQFNAVVEYFEEYSMFDSEDDRHDDAYSCAVAIDEILKDNADE